VSENKRAPRPQYPAEFRERAVRMVFEHEHEYPTQWKAIESLSKEAERRPGDASPVGEKSRDRRRQAPRA
jgi:transposase-like protein